LYAARIRLKRSQLAFFAQYILRNKIYCATIPFVGKDQDQSDDKRSIERELKRGSLELIVLHLLASGEAYGYEIVSKLTAETNGALEVTDGTLYPVLYRLERAGSVTVRWETPERGVPRKYYRLTESGRDELARLTHEWTTFAKAMTKLLRQTKEG
jgi:PadR family transcriptional regulator PadR